MDNIVFFVLLLVIAGKDVLCRKHGHPVKAGDGKIVGGYNTTIENVPYQVYILVRIGTDYYQCGGSIISPRYILTAAHCLTGVSEVRIRAGSADANNGGQTYTTTTYYQHPQYNPRTSDYDVGVIRLRRNMVIDNHTTKAVTLAASGSNMTAGEDLLVTGWGATSENGATNTELLAVIVKIITDEECRKTYSSFTNRMFCAGVPEGGKDSCQGDSGGPTVLSSNGLQVGIVSFGTGCARPGVPGAYCKVGAVPIRNWIKLTTGV